VLGAEVKRFYLTRRTNRTQVARLELDGGYELGDDFAFIARIWVSPEARGQGIGTALLRRALADADDEGVELQLYPDPEHNTIRNRRRLIAWYERHGFSGHGLGGGYMRRRPRDA
jgi:ribosomal protein S18 acetylase RimI-like enzyme